MTLAKINMEDMKHANMKKAFATGILAILIMTISLNFVVSLTGPRSLSEGLTAAFLVWLATTVPAELHGMAWEQRPFQSFLINASNALLSFCIAVTIISQWPW